MKNFNTISKTLTKAGYDVRMSAFGSYISAVGGDRSMEIEVEGKICRVWVRNTRGKITNRFSCPVAEFLTMVY